MGLVDEVQNEIVRPGPRCSIGIAFDKLPAEGQADLATVLADAERYPHAAVTRALRNRGYKLGGGAVSAHRSGNCSCRSQTK